jgi:hypothetical protein
VEPALGPGQTAEAPQSGRDGAMSLPPALAELRSTELKLQTSLLLTTLMTFSALRSAERGEHNCAGITCGRVSPGLSSGGNK